MSIEFYTQQKYRLFAHFKDQKFFNEFWRNVVKEEGKQQSPFTIVVGDLQTFLEAIQNGCPAGNIGRFSTTISKRDRAYPVHDVLFQLWRAEQSFPSIEKSFGFRAKILLNHAGVITFDPDDSDLSDGLAKKIVQQYKIDTRGAAGDLSHQNSWDIVTPNNTHLYLASGDINDSYSYAIGTHNPFYENTPATEVGTALTDFTNFSQYAVIRMFNYHNRLSPNATVVLRPPQPKQ